jgi:hypothetical protein
MLTIPIQFDDLLKVVEKLSPEQKRILREHLEAEEEIETVSDIQEPLLKERIPNLHPGAIWTSDDFDDPLPDEFWLGEDA